jgi:hypothetical protein
MRRKSIAIIACLVIALVGITGNVVAEGMGPAPNSGDGIPDGSGFDSPNGEQNGPGPAPNSGDGIPDGPGWE